MPMATGTVGMVSAGVYGSVQDGEAHGGGVHPTIHIIRIIHTIRRLPSSSSSLRSILSRHHKKRSRSTGISARMPSITTLILNAVLVSGCGLVPRRPQRMKVSK